MGWPSDKHSIDKSVMRYWQIKDIIIQEDGVLYKGEQSIIPFSLRSGIKEKLHAAHLGSESMIRRTRTKLYSGQGSSMK